MSLLKNKYIVIKKVINKDLSDFCYNYLRVKKQVYDTCIKSRYISPFEKILGEYETDKDQVANTYSTYGDIAMDTLMLKIQPIMEQKTKLKLTPAYTYARVYKKGDILERHKDRFSCEISTTLNLGGDNWPIYVEPSGKENKKGVKVNLKPGDMLIYLGCELEHWREPFEGDECVQVFLHYNNVKTKGAEKNIFDTRIHIGLPGWFKRDGK